MSVQLANPMGITESPDSAMASTAKSLFGIFPDKLVRHVISCEYAQISI